MENMQLETKTLNNLEAAFMEADNIIMKKYMKNIGEYDIKDVDNSLAEIDLNSIFRLYRIDKIIYNTEENNLEKLMNVYNAVGLCGGSIINIIISDGKKIEYYIGTKSSDLNNIAACQDTLASVMKGNFPGTDMCLQKKDDMYKCLEKIFGSNEKIISLVSGIPGYRNEKNNDNQCFSQGIEKVIDSMNGKKYALITISSRVDSSNISKIINSYESLYTQLSPFAETELSYNESESNSVAKSITAGITKSVSDSLTFTSSNSTSKTEGTSKSEGINGSLFVISTSSNNTSNSGFTDQKGNSLAYTKGVSNAESLSESKTDTISNTSGKSLQIHIENKAVKNLLEKINSMIKRIEDSVDLGLWNSATYCVAEDSQTSHVLAGTIESLFRGEKGSVENFAVETWEEENNKKVKSYLSKMVHPIAVIDGKYSNLEVSTASLINGKELVIEAGLPQKSIAGLPISEMLAFSRNVISESKKSSKSIALGKVYHMGYEEEADVNLNLESLTSHMLITGSTGSGKSNTVYHILKQLKKTGIKFLVIEPTKGEYKNIFGKEANVFSTNEKYTELLQINPFAFPESIDVLEHVDRLIEIFNVCWPMYAAMPAVLKEAILNAYERTGWILEESVNINKRTVFPTFKDLLRELVNVIEYSAYSEEVKSNYIGSLVTRVKSLTNGINGKIFNGSSIEYSKLFDEDTVIDLSRVGSNETKSLLMGLIVMNLNEYRMDQSQNLMNRELNHVTVLEEAHHLLKNSVISSNMENSGNLSAKSVEMISNAIAEMRTYGEGFIIVDQSPGAIDVSAVKNTNTKVILRLPEENDRRQAGKSAALKDKQIDELAKLYKGIAVVYQNNWLDPVLCKIDKADVLETLYDYKKKEEKKNYNEDLLKLLMKNRVDERYDLDLSQIEIDLEKANLSTTTKLILKETVADLKYNKEPFLFNKKNFKKLSEVVVEVLDLSENIQRYFDNIDDCVYLQHEINRVIDNRGIKLSNEMLLAVSQCIIRELVEKDKNKVELYSKWREFAVEQRKMG